jgi:tetratricopeptide (TPR) repeat protein
LGFVSLKIMIKKKDAGLFYFFAGVLLCLLTPAGPVFAEDAQTAGARILALNREIIAANERRDLPAALQAAEEAVRVAKAELGQESPAAADTMSNLASLYLHIKRPAEAEQIYKETVPIYYREYGGESETLAKAYFNLGGAYAMQQKYNDALDVLHKAFAIRTKKLGPDDAATKNVRQMISEIEKLAPSQHGK